MPSPAPDSPHPTSGGGGGRTTHGMDKGSMFFNPLRLREERMEEREGMLRPPIFEWERGLTESSSPVVRC